MTNHDLNEALQFCLCCLHEAHNESLRAFWKIEFTIIAAEKRATVGLDFNFMR